MTKGRDNRERQSCATTLLDPVSAYDRIAPVYQQISKARSAYLDAIDRLVLANIPSSSVSMLDVGAGDGRRAFAIARAANISDLVLLEPSVEMQRYWPPETSRWTMHAEDIVVQHRRFDVITCLWNVLGHVGGRGQRTAVLAKLARLLSPAGVIFLDVNNRYNTRSYGLAKTALRFAQDRLCPRETNGDVTVTWPLNGATCKTTGHVFTEAEVRSMASAAKLKVEKRFVVDYSTGEIQRRCFAGNLLFIMRP